MGYGWDEEDVGGYFAEQDSYIEDCEFYDGKCGKCPHKYSCQSSDYNQRRLGEYR